MDQPKLLNWWVDCRECMRLEYGGGLQNPTGYTEAEIVRIYEGQGWRDTPLGWLCPDCWRLPSVAHKVNAKHRRMHYHFEGIGT